MAFPGIVCWFEAVAAVVVSLYHTLWVGSAGAVVKAARAIAPRGLGLKRTSRGSGSATTEANWNL